MALTAAYLVGVSLSEPTSAATVLNVPGDCSLPDAILAADKHATVRGPDGSTCSNPGGSTAIDITAGEQSSCDEQNEGTTIDGVPTALPDITANVTIEGVGSVGIYSNSCPTPAPGGGGKYLYYQGYRLFYVASTGRLTLRNLQIDGYSIYGAEPTGGAAGDAYGGAIYAEGPLTLQNVLMSNNSAAGGTLGPEKDTTNFDWDGGSAYGGAIYSTSNVVVTGSVFYDNTVTGSDAIPATGISYELSRPHAASPAGGSGGDAMGADVALGPNAQAQVSGTVFQSSVATGGSADAGYAGLDGPAGQDGTSGFCPADDPDDVTTGAADASGTPGHPGSNGLDGGNGGNGGSAVGAIYGGAAVSLLSSAVLDSQAVTGAAGIGGAPGIGGNGGAGGAGVECEYTTSLFGQDDYYGAGNYGGDGGDNGQSWGESGIRGDAVATVSTPGPLLFMNTTVSGTQATVPPDIVPDNYEAASCEADGVATVVGNNVHGCEATGQTGQPGTPGCGYYRDQSHEPRKAIICAPDSSPGTYAPAASRSAAEQSCRLGTGLLSVTGSQCVGSASIFASTWAGSSGLSTGDGVLANGNTDQADADWSTFVGNEVSTPQVQYREFGTSPYLTDAAGNILGTVVQENGAVDRLGHEFTSLSCKHLISGGYNQVYWVSQETVVVPGGVPLGTVADIAGCDPGMPTDLSSKTPIVSPDRSSSGAALVPEALASKAHDDCNGACPDVDYWMVTQAPLISPRNGVGPPVSVQGSCPPDFDGSWALGFGNAASPLVSPFWPLDYDAAGYPRTGYCSPGAAQYHLANPTLIAAPNLTSVTLGTSAPTLKDSATLSGGKAPTGQVTFTLHDPAGTLVDTETASVPKNGKQSTPTGYKLPTTGTVTGTYQWDAAYNGDTKNNSASDDNASDEQVTVSAAKPSISTVPAPTSVTLATSAPTLRDSATLSGGYHPTGTVTFRLYRGNYIYNTETVVVHGNGKYSTRTGYRLPAGGSVVGRYRWVPGYSGDTNNHGIIAKAGPSVTVSPASPALSTVPSARSVTLGTSAPTLKDSATLSRGYYPTGQIIFYLYYNGGTTSVDHEIAKVSGNGTYSTLTGYKVPTTGTVTGTYQWDASYSGDGSNSRASDDKPSNERVTVSNASPSLTTAPSPTAVTFGSTSWTTSPLTDSATLSGGFSPTGTVTFTLYYSGGSTPVATETVAVSGNGTYSTSTGYTLPSPGTYQWDASYSGNSNNASVADNNAANEVVTVNEGPASPTTSSSTTSSSTTTLSTTTSSTTTSSTTTSSTTTTEGG